MNWGSLSAFVAMGGYGLYVWGSYGLAAIAIGLEVAALVGRHRSAKRALRATGAPR